MAYFIEGIGYENKEIAKNLGAFFDKVTKKWYFTKPQTKKAKIELEEKLNKLKAMGFEIREIDLQYRKAKSIGTYKFWHCD